MPRLRRSFASPVLVLALVGCTAQAPNAPLVSGRDMGPRPENMDLLPPDDGVVKPPVVEAPIRQTAYLSVPLQGLAEPGTSVLVDGTASGSVFVDVAGDGRFCTDVALRPDRDNPITLRAIDGAGNQSASVALSIRQTGAPATPPTSPTSQNAVIRGSASSNHLLLQHADESALIDGDDVSYFGGHHIPFTSYASMTVRLGDRSRINRVRLQAPTSCPFTAPLEVYVSNADAPSSPGVAPMMWQRVPVTNGTPERMTAELASSTVATHVAVLWPYDPWGAGGLNCGSWALGPYYGLAEVEAWTVPNLPPPPPQAPSCSGGAP